MKDDLWKRQEVDSPCLKVCVMHPGERICLGCHRTIDEISAWSRMTQAERTRITTELPSRAGLLKKRRGGRNGRLNTSKV